MAQATHDVFRAIGDPSRRQILSLLSKQRRSINSLAENFDMSRPAVSKHIKILHATGFISIEDEGRERYCMLNRDGFLEVQRWINFFDTFWQVRLTKLGTLLDSRESTRKNGKHTTK